MTVNEDFATWLRAQLDSEARTATEALPEMGDPAVYPDYRTYDVPSAVDQHIALWGPARVLAEIDVKRQILDLHRNGGGGRRDPRRGLISFDWHVDVCTECDSEWPFGIFPNGEYGYLPIWGDPPYTMVSHGTYRYLDPDAYGEPTMWPCRTLRMLALSYAGCPGWREEWRP